jgi:hypothetical protein
MLAQRNWENRSLGLKPNPCPVPQVRERPVRADLGRKWGRFRHYALWEVRVVDIESEWKARDREASKTCVGTRIFLCPG